MCGSMLQCEGLCYQLGLVVAPFVVEIEADTVVGRIIIAPRLKGRHLGLHLVLSLLVQFPRGTKRKPLRLHRN